MASYLLPYLNLTCCLSARIKVLLLQQLLVVLLSLLLTTFVSSHLSYARLYTKYNPLQHLIKPSQQHFKVDYICTFQMRILKLTVPSNLTKQGNGLQSTIQFYTIQQGSLQQLWLCIFKLIKVKLKFIFSVTLAVFHILNSHRCQQLPYCRYGLQNISIIMASSIGHH